MGITLVILKRDIPFSCVFCDILVRYVRVRMAYDQYLSTDNIRQELSGLLEEVCPCRLVEGVC